MLLHEEGENMLKESTTSQAIAINFILMTLWYLVCFGTCIHLNISHFDCSKRQYQPRPWEQNGKWYQKHLKIKKWKDRLPQHIGKEGFSKKNFTTVSLGYIDDFILETCRGEWDHSRNCIYGLISLAISPPIVGFVFLLITLLLNVPFIIIQRYNRFRLQALRQKVLKQEKKLSN